MQVVYGSHHHTNATTSLTPKSEKSAPLSICHISKSTNKPRKSSSDNCETSCLDVLTRMGNKGMRRKNSAMFPK